MSDCCQSCEPRPSGTPGDSSDRPSGHPGPGSDDATTLRVTGMDCGDEVAAIERVLKPLAGVREVRANLMGGTVTVAHEPSVTEAQFIQAIATAGLKASGVESGGSIAPADAQRSRLISLGLSGACTGLGLARLVFLVPPQAFGGAWAVWTYRALVLLVIACPCALVISTPVSIVSGLTAMARRGVLIKGGAFLEAIGKLQALAVDKTGTITEGRPRVTKVISMNGTPEVELVRIAAAIDIHSTHPLAQAVVDHWIATKWTR